MTSTPVWGGTFGDNDRLRKTPGPGDEIGLYPTITWNVGNGSRLRLDHYLPAGRHRGGRLLEANLTQLGTVYQINIRTSCGPLPVRVIVVAYPELFIANVSAHEEHLFSQLLFS